MIKMLKRFFIAMSVILVIMWADVRFFSEARGSEETPKEPTIVTYQVEFVNANKVYSYDGDGKLIATVIPCDDGGWTERKESGVCYTLGTDDQE